MNALLSLGPRNTVCEFCVYVLVEGWAGGYCSRPSFAPQPELGTYPLRPEDATNANENGSRIDWWASEHHTRPRTTVIAIKNEGLGGKGCYSWKNNSQFHSAPFLSPLWQFPLVLMQSHLPGRMVWLPQCYDLLFKGMQESRRAALLSSIPVCFFFP